MQNLEKSTLFSIHFFMKRNNLKQFSYKGKTFLIDENDNFIEK